jgi:phage terminase large subunit-like protein
VTIARHQVPRPVPTPSRLIHGQCQRCGMPFVTSTTRRLYCSTRCGRLARQRPGRRAAEPFTLDHFRAWAAQLILENGEHLILDRFEEEFLTDVFAGFAECWLIVPEENGKTTLVAALALYHAEFRAGAVVPVAASSREQSEILYHQADGFVVRSGALHQAVYSALQLVRGKRKTDVPRFTCLEGYRRINHFRGGRIQIFAADDRTGDGQIPTLGILEELHRHRSLALYRTWVGKLRKRGGQVVAISTGGEKGSEFEQTREKIRQSATDVQRRPGFARYVAGSMVMHEYAVPEGADVSDMALVKTANPSPRITIASLRAKFDSPTMTLAHWRRFVCDLADRSEDAAITEAEWQAARTDAQIPAGQPIWLGLDVAWKYDTTAAVPLWPRNPNDRLLGPASVLVPPRDGSTLHPDEVKAALRSIHGRNPIHTVVMDTSRAEDIAAWIEEELGAVVIDRPQTNPHAAHDFSAFMEALRNGWLHHAGDAGLTQHALNAVARLLPLGDARFDRPNPGRFADQDRRVIDALTAAAMVHSQATATVEAEPEVKPWVIIR